jgi:hypothetical protein
VHGENDPNAVDLTPNLPKLTRPHAPEQRVAATRGIADSGEEPDDDRDSTSEARARRGGPKYRRSMPQEAKAMHTSAAANHKNVDNGTDRKKPMMPRTGRMSVDKDPTTEDLHPKVKKPKTKRPKGRREATDLNRKRTG